MDVTADPGLCAALRADLRDADYTATSVRAAWGPIADDAIGRGLHGPALRALGERTDALAVLARVLFLGGAAAVSDVDAALPRLGARGLHTLGLASIDGERVVAAARVRRCRGIRPLVGRQ